MRTNLAAILTIVLASVAGACAGNSGKATQTAPLSPSPSATAPSAAATATRLHTTAPGVTPTPEQTFSLEVAPIDDQEMASMIAHHVWHEGCPIGFAGLRLLTLSYWGYDGATHRGQLVVNVDAVDAMSRALHSLFDARFPTERMELVDAYEGDDDTSMAANNTSAFNCRLVPGTTTWSQHAYGRAIDINPLVNPELEDGRVYPPQGARYADRSLQEAGMIHAGDSVVQAFEAVGWHWGGYWDTPKDYQHFSWNGY